jgi:hypothetical protein
MKRLTWVVAVVLLAVVLASGAWVLRARDGAAAGPVAILHRGGPRAPAGQRIRVQVLNTTRSRGMARRATRLLRDRGFDVVEMGTTTPMVDTTLVLDRSGHPAWAAVAAAVLQPARVLTRPDSSRYLDVTVLLGSTWRPPAEPLNP